MTFRPNCRTRVLGSNPVRRRTAVWCALPNTAILMIWTCRDFDHRVVHHTKVTIGWAEALFELKHTVYDIELPLVAR